MSAKFQQLTAQSVRTPGDTTADSRDALAYVWLLGLTGRPELPTAGGS